MRFHLTSMRYVYGVPIFVTFAPDEKHNLLMVRLSRTRRKDPVLCAVKGRTFCGHDEPPIDGEGGDVQTGRRPDGHRGCRRARVDPQLRRA